MRKGKDLISAAIEIVPQHLANRFVVVKHQNSILFLSQLFFLFRYAERSNEPQVRLYFGTELCLLPVAAVGSIAWLA